MLTSLLQCHADSANFSQTTRRACHRQLLCAAYMSHASASWDILRDACVTCLGCGSKEYSSHHRMRGMLG